MKMKFFPDNLTMMLDEQADGNNGYVYSVWENKDDAQKVADGKCVLFALTITEEAKGRQASPEIGREDEPDYYYTAEYDSAVGKVTIIFNGRSFQAFPLDEFPEWECDMNTL